MINKPPSDDARPTDSAKGTAIGSATNSSSAAEGAQARERIAARLLDLSNGFGGEVAEVMEKAADLLFASPAQAEQEIATLKAENEMLRTQLQGARGLRREAEQARAALRQALQAICDDAVGETGDPLWIVRRDLIVAGDAVLRSPVERTRDEEKDLSRHSSASEAPDMGISANTPTRKAQGE